MIIDNVCLVFSVLLPLTSISEIIILGLFQSCLSNGLVIPWGQVLATSTVHLPGRLAWRPSHRRRGAGCSSVTEVWAQPHQLLCPQLSEGPAAQQTLRGLQPFTTYSVGVEACTCFNCCSRGPTAELRTRPAPPAGVASPHIQALASRTASVLWSPPLFPNGIIQR